MQCILFSFLSLPLSLSFSRCIYLEVWFNNPYWIFRFFFLSLSPFLLLPYYHESRERNKLSYHRHQSSAWCSRTISLVFRTLARKMTLMEFIEKENDAHEERRAEAKGEWMVKIYRKQWLHLARGVKSVGWFEYAMKEQLTNWWSNERKNRNRRGNDFRHRLVCYDQVGRRGLIEQQ